MKNIMSTVKSVVRHVVDTAKRFVNYIKTVTGKNDSVYEYVEYVEEATTETVVNEDGYIEYVENLETSYDVETVYIRPATRIAIIKDVLKQFPKACRFVEHLVDNCGYDENYLVKLMGFSAFATIVCRIETLSEQYILVH